MSRVCILTSVHSVFDVRIFHKQARSLAQAGHSVTLIAQYGDSQLVSSVQVIALPEPVNRRQRMLGTWRILKEALRQHADVYHFHDPGLIPTGLLIKLLTGKAVIYDVHEDVPRQILSKPWIPKGLRRPLATVVEGVEALGAKVFDRIVVATPAIGRRFPIGKTVTVQNYPILGELVAVQSCPYMDRPPVVAYVGGITEIRGAREMVQAIGLVTGVEGVRLLLAGSCNPPKLEAELQPLVGCERTRFVGWLSRRQVGDLLGQARMGLVLFHPAPNHTDAQPNKLFEYMSAGIPVVASDFPLWKQIIDETGCGLLVDPLVPQAIAEAIQWLLEHPAEAGAMGKRGQEAVRARYNWGREAQELLGSYEELLK